MGSCASAQRQRQVRPSIIQTKKPDDTYSSSSTEPRNSTLAIKLNQDVGDEARENDEENEEQPEHTPVREFEDEDEDGSNPEINEDDEDGDKNDDGDEEEVDIDDAADEEEDENCSNDDDDDGQTEEVEKEEEDEAVEDEEAEDIDDEDKPEELDIVGSIISGNIDIEVPSQVRLVRIFTSSTFTDTFVERNNLMEKVYPKLKKYCQSVGYDFQVVDMRWGVRDEATDDHMTSELCMRELRACQKLSTGPNFITFLGQKYGYRPFPPKILHSEFEAMLDVIEKQEDKDLLNKWFIKDDNLVPAMYILQPVRSLLPNYNNRSVSAEERSEASGKWWAAFESMQVILREASANALLNENEVAKYRISVTEDEIRRGIVNAKNRNEHCYWFKRNIVDIKENLDKKRARLFIDKTGNSLDEDAVSLLENFKSKKMLKLLPKENVTDYDVAWHGETCIDPVANEAHRTYIDKLCDDFYAVLIEMINKGIEEKRQRELEDSLVKEISLHTTYCQDKSKVFYGREKIIEAILDHVDSEGPNRVLVLNGESGCGKTSIMAVAAKKIKERYPDVPLVLRFLGTTSESSTISKLLLSICVQLCRITGKKVSSIPQKFKKMMKYFGEFLTSEIETKVIIVLDSLDQLSADDGGLNMKWLPKEISEFVKVIVSTLPAEEYKVLPALKSRVSEDSFVEVPVLPNDTACQILDAWLQHANHTLTVAQKDIVLNAFNLCPLPLFLKLSFDEAVRWKSYTPPEESILHAAIKESINGLFARLERLHGLLLVSHALGYITASVNGLTDAEMDNILSIDDEVLNDVYQYWTPPLRKIPPLLWIRLKTDLGSYIVSRGADGALVNQWYHRQFIETARERYLQADVAVKLHGTLADYFVGKWSGGVRKPFTNKQGEQNEKDRLVPSQPNIFPKQQEQQENEVYNYRKLSELPRHLLKSGNINALKEEVLFNFDFLSAEVCALGLRNVLQDFNEALEVYAGETEIELVRDCLKTSAKALYNDRNQLASQLNGRLRHLETFENITNLLEQSRKMRRPCLYPSVACFERPGGKLVHSLAGHTGMVQFACFSKDGKRLLSASQDNTLRLWDLTNGEEIRVYDVGATYNVIKFYNDDNGVIMAGFSGLVAMDLESEETFFNDECIIGQYGNCMDLIANGTKVVHAGSEKISVFDVDGSDVRPGKVYEDAAVDNSTGYFDTISGGGNYYAYTRGKNTELTIRRTDDENYLKKLKVPYGLMYFIFNEDGSQLVALGTNSSMQDPSKEVHLVIWDTSSWNVIKDSPSKFDAMVITMYHMSIAKLKTGLELIWPVLYQINLWNLETSVERITLRSGYQGNQYKQAITGDGRLLAIISMDYSQWAIDVYNLELLEYVVGGDQQSSAIEKAVAFLGKGEKEAYLCPTSPDIVLSIPPAEGIITVWNTQYHDRERQIRFEGLFPSALHCIDDQYVVIWDYNTRKIYLIDYMEGKIAGVISGKISTIPPNSQYTNWHYMGDFKMLAPSEDGKQINLWDLKTGKLLSTIKTGSSLEYNSLLVSKDKSSAVIGLNDVTGSKTTLPAISIDLKSNKKLTEIQKKDHRMDLRPVTSAIYHDGSMLYVTFTNNNITVFDTKTGKEKRIIKYQPSDIVVEDFNPDESVIIYCLETTEQYIFACLSCLGKVGNTFENNYRLVCFDINTYEAIAWKSCHYYQAMSKSEDGRRLLCMSQAVLEDAKSLELWDLSHLNEKKLIKLGSFLPETDLRFHHLTLNGDCVCAGISNTAELVFLQLCGEEQRKTRVENCTELKIVFEAEKK